ncbi:Ubiquitin fusion degradation protein 4, partial [Phlyctochytrium bullatum]
TLAERSAGLRSGSCSQEGHGRILNNESSVATVKDLCLDFTLPGYPDVELLPGGANIDVTDDNVQDYLERVADLTVGSGIRHQVEAFRQGFDKVFPVEDMKIFSVEELSLLLGGSETEDWSVSSMFQQEDDD